MSTCGGEPSPTFSPLWSIGASSFSPSPITTTPSMWIVCSTAFMPSTAAWSAASLSPRPTQRAAWSAAASVTRTSSSARFRSGGISALAERYGCCSFIYRTPGGLRGRSVPPARMAPPIAIRITPAIERNQPMPRPISPDGSPGRSMIPR